MNLMKKETGNGFMLASVLMGGILLFSFQAQAQDQSTTMQTTTQTTQTTVSTDQDEPRSTSKARAGIKGGMNISNLITDEVTDRNVRVGFHAGVYGQVFSSNAFAIQPEINYSTKGNKVVTDFSIIDQETKFNLNYIDLPILAVFKLGNVAEIHAGPYWSYLVGANVDTDGDLGDDFQQLDRDNFDDWDYGLVGGVGFNLGDLQLGARYSYGLNEIAESSGAKRVLGNTKNSVGQIYLAFNLAGHN